MPRKKIDFNVSTKLKGLSTVNDREKDNLLDIISTNLTSRPTSFRLRTIDVDRIDEALNKVNSFNLSQPLNKTALIRGLIMLALESNPKKILDYIRKSL